MKKIRLGLLTGVFALSMFSVGVSAAEVDSVVHVDDSSTSTYTQEGAYTGTHNTYLSNQKLLRKQITTSVSTEEPVVVEPVVVEPTIVEAEVIEPVIEPVTVKKGKRK